MQPSILHACLEVLDSPNQKPATGAAGVATCRWHPGVPDVTAVGLSLSRRRQRVRAAARGCHRPEDVERAWGVGIQDDHLRGGGGVWWGWGGVVIGGRDGRGLLAFILPACACTAEKCDTHVCLRIAAAARR